jgi:Malate synthase
MSSAQNVPSIGVGASRLAGCGQMRTAGALELLAALHRTFGPCRAELPEPLVVRDTELAGRRFPASWPGRRTWGGATGGRPCWPRAWSITGSRSPAPADRERVINALHCGAKIFMADFEDSNAPMFDNPVTGRLNLRNVSRRRYRRRSPDSAASRMPGKQPATSSPPGSEPTAVEMVDASALRAVEPPSGTAIRPASSLSWSSNCTARRSWPRRWRAWASRCPSRTSCSCSMHRSKAYRSRHLADAPDGPRQAGLAQYPDGRFDTLAPFTKEYVHARRLPAGL